MFSKKKKKLKMKEAMDIWLQSKKYFVKESTYARYYGLIETQLKPQLGEYYTCQIDDFLIKDFVYNKLKNGNLHTEERLSNKTVKDLIIILNQIFKYYDLRINFPVIKLEKKKITTLTEKERIKLENYILVNKSPVELGILLSLYCGLRIGEVCALKWQNIDLENKIIHIKHTLSRIKNTNGKEKKTKIYCGDPKSSNSKRIIPIPDSIVPILKELTKEEANYLITGTTSFMEPRCFYYRYKKIIASLHISNIDYHALRHTFATRCIELGFDPKTLSEILGHSDVKITLSLYVHPSFTLKMNSMNKLTL